MSANEQEMDEALDALELEHGSLDEQKVDLDEQKVDLDEQKGEQQSDDKPEKPPGFLSYEDWIAKGKDPADYRGENAYNTEYGRLKENRELKEAMKQVADSVVDLKQQYQSDADSRVEQAKTELLADIEQAKTDNDPEAALEAQDKLHKLSKTPAQVQVNPIISDFAHKNPIIDTASTQYDAAFHQDMIMIHNGKLDQLLGGDRSRANELTPDQIERVQTMAYNQAKELHADKFTSHRNRRPAPATPSKRSAPKGDSTLKLKDVKGNSKNPRDATPANDIYEILKAKDPKAAETFLKNMTGD